MQNPLDVFLRSVAAFLARITNSLGIPNKLFPIKLCQLHIYYLAPVTEAASIWIPQN